MDVAKAVLVPRTFWAKPASFTCSGYEAGDVIGDHDHALCYIMDRVASALLRRFAIPEV